MVENYGAGETYKRFCRAPGHKCFDYAECYSNKHCQHAPDDGDLESPFKRRDEAAAVLPATCHADAHYGPVTVSGRTLRCSNCGYLWEIASEGPGPK